MNTPTLRAAAAHDADDIRALLARSELPTSDLESARPEFVAAYEGGTLVGAGALQHFGTTALIRSVAVTEDRRGSGLGQRLVQALERRAREQGLTELVLLTQTAKTFFEHQGYRVIERASAPSAVQTSEEFRSLCPQSAVCMSKSL